MTDELERNGRAIPIVEEQAVILKRKKLSGGVRVQTKVREEEEVVDEPLTSEDVDVERVPLDRWVDGPVPIRQEGPTTILTLVEEVLVVEKRLRAVEEVRITKSRAVRHEPRTVTLRREEAMIERLEPAGSEPNPD